MLDLFQNVLRRLRNDCLAKGYELILEADLTGWLFHLLLTEPQVHPDQVHLNTRLCHDRHFFDIAIGSLDSGAGPRPCIRPRLVVEAKLFPRIGFTNQQHRVHYEHILNNDLPKLGRLSLADECPVSLIVDGAAYLEGFYKLRNRMDSLVDTRNRVSPGVHLFVIRLVGGNWDIEHKPPS